MVVSVGAFATGIQRFTSLIHPTSNSDGLRLNIWASTARMLRDHPAWGVGLDQFVSQYPRYLKPDAWQEPNRAAKPEESHTIPPKSYLR